MILDWVKFQKAYTTSSENIKSLIDSDTFTKCANDICRNYNIETKHKGSIVVSAVYKLLNIDSDEKISQILTEEGIPKEKTQAIITEIDQCIIENTEQKLEANAVYNEINQTEAALETISPIRTMAGDSNQKEQVYSSHQSAILNEGK